MSSGTLTTGSETELQTWLTQHLHGPTFGGLAGGAVDVYARSAGWREPAGPPRPLPAINAVGDLPTSQITEVILVTGLGLARAVRDSPDWHRYITDLLGSAEAAFDNVAGGDSFTTLSVHVLRDPAADIGGTELDALTSARQRLAPYAATDGATLSREVAQAITQHIQLVSMGRAATSNFGTDDRGRITVFVSHTKFHTASQQEAGPLLLERVRHVLRNTHLGEFFDAADIQPGSRWADVLRKSAGRSAMLVVRTDLYAGREWTQYEVVEAKRNDVPVVCLYAVRDGESRGSFLMDHVPVVVCPADRIDAAIEQALNQLVDESLKRVLWGEQTVYLRRHGFDWLPAQAPEAVTLLPWLLQHQISDADDSHVWVMHPDPPLGPQERAVLVEMCQLAGYSDNVDILTPSTFASRGGRLRRSEPSVVSSEALRGKTVGISVSDSSDLARLGLTPLHCEVAVAELTRAILLAGGDVVYGGRMRPEGYSQIMMDEVRRYADGRESLTICLAEPEHRKFSDDELREIVSRFGFSARLVCLDAEGRPIDPLRRPEPGAVAQPARAYAAMRKYLTGRVDARVLVGGKLRNFSAAMPGVIEEALLSIRAGQPLYVGAGYGGAAAAIAQTLGIDGGRIGEIGWPIDDLDANAAAAALALLSAEYETHGAAFDGMSDKERHQLAVTHRPADMASLVILGLSRVASRG